MAIDYSSIDAAIVSCIENGADTFGAIFPNRKVKEACVAAFGDERADCYRIVDRRLQSLRKRGAIELHKRKWAVRHG